MNKEPDSYDNLWATAVTPPENRPKAETPKQAKHTGISIIFILIGLLIIGSGFLLKAVNDKAKITFQASTTGVIQSGAVTSNYRDCDSDGDCSTKYECDFQVEYSPNKDGNHTINGNHSDRCGSEETAGAIVEVFYESANVNNATINDPNGFSANFGPYALWLFGGIFTAAGVFFLRRDLRA